MKDPQAEPGTRKPGRGWLLQSYFALEVGGVYQADHPTSADQDQVIPGWFKIPLLGQPNCN